MQKKFLRYNNYYFKLKSYAKNYPINPKNGKYVNLEFAYLVELSKLDMYLRKIILGMCLDVEHILKQGCYMMSVEMKKKMDIILSKNIFGHILIQR